MGVPHQREAPPQVLMVCPVMYSPSSETRNATSFATSSGCWILPSLMSRFTRVSFAAPTEMFSCTQLED